MIYISFNGIWPQGELKKKISPDPDGAAKARVSARVTHTPSPISAPIFNPVFTGQVSLRFPSTFNCYFTPPPFSRIMCVASILTATFVHNFYIPHIFKPLAFDWIVLFMTCGSWRIVPCHLDSSVSLIILIFGYSSFSRIMCHFWSSIFSCRHGFTNL